jgi:hypothetical protein
MDLTGENVEYFSAPYPIMRSALKPCVWAGLLIAFLQGIQVIGAQLEITSIDPLPDGRLRLRFEDTGLGLLNYVPATRFSLSVGTTNRLDPSRRITELAPGVFETVVPDPGTPIAFFRIAGFSTPDADEDGLSDALEAMLGTSTNTFDSDGDHFGDANEIVNGSDPLRASSVPDVIRINFASAQSSAREGDGVLTVPITLSRSFTGAVHYSVAAVSTAISGADFAALPGTVAVSGVNGAIPIQVMDDLIIEDTKLLVIDLKSDPDEKYQTGGASRHTVLLFDNDSHWSGTLTSEGSEQAIRLRILRQGTSVQAALVSNFDTNNTDNMRGIGAIPHGVWQMATATLTTNSLNAVSTPIPVGSSTLFGGSALNRILTLSSQPGPGGANPGTNYLFKPNLIIGTYSDQLIPANPDLQYLGRQTTGLFVLIEDLATMPFPIIPSASQPAAPTVATAR